MPIPVLTAPQPADAEPWFDFLIAQQAAAYAGTVPTDFAEQQRTYRDTWVPSLAANFAKPGSRRSMVAKVNDTIVGIASIGDAPQQWEEELGLLPVPASRQLERLYVDPAYHGTGLADALFANVDDGRPMYLWIISNNQRARRFYSRRGFSDLDETFAAGPSWGGVAMHRMLRAMAR